MAFVKKKGVEMFNKSPIKQMLEIIKSHAVVAFCLFFLGLFAETAVYRPNIGMIVFMIFKLLIYFFVIYADTYKIAKHDKKSYTKEEPYFYKGFLLPIGLIIITVLLYIVYYLVWKHMTVDGSFVSIAPRLLNLAFIIWSYPCKEVIGLKEGFIEWYGFIILIILPVIISGIGYFAGLKEFDINSLISKIVYEEKDNNGKRK